jgi:hypothetical protein
MYLFFQKGHIGVQSNMFFLQTKGDPVPSLMLTT